MKWVILYLVLTAAFLGFYFWGRHDARKELEEVIIVLATENIKLENALHNKEDA